LVGPRHRDEGERCHVIALWPRAILRGRGLAVKKRVCRLLQGVLTRGPACLSLRATGGRVSRSPCGDRRT